MKQVKVCVLRAAGTNCDQETAYAFSIAGAVVDILHINTLLRDEQRLAAYHILALPGGFTYGDDVAAGKIVANELRYRLKHALIEFIRARKLIIGICNGFQILLKSGLLPGNADFIQEASLIINDSGRFEDRWVYLKSARLSSGKQRCVWIQGVPECIYLPVAHGEGKFVVRVRDVLENLNDRNQVVFRYCDDQGQSRGYPYNPNNSVDDIAGICDETGRIFGLMPHPERHIINTQHPRWSKADVQDEGDGLRIFRNGVEYIIRNL